MNQLFRKYKPGAGKRRFTFEVDTTQDMKDLTFICECKARVKSKEHKNKIEIVDVPVSFIQEDKS